MTESAGHTYLKEHALSADALMLDFNEQSAGILDEARQSNVSRAARTLIKDGPLRITIVGFADGGALKEHSAGGPVAVQVLQGEVEISTGGKAEPLVAGQSLVFGANIQHSVVAHKPSVVLLTIAMA